MKIFKMALCQTQTSLVVEHCQHFSASHPSPKLIEQLHSQREKQTLKMYLRGSHAHGIQLRALALISLLLVHGQGFEEVAQQHLTIDEKLSKDWLHGKILNPYKHFLKRYSETSDFFCLASSSEINNDRFIRNLPYLVGMLKQLSVIAESIEKLGRYFTASKNQMGLSSVFFAQAFMILTNAFYSHLRLSLQSYLHMLRRNRQEIETFKQILRWFFGQVLPQINQSVARLNYNKYLDFKSKGMTIKLFKIDQQSSVIQTIIKQVMRKEGFEDEQKLELESMIFPEDGSFNEGIFMMALAEPMIRKTSMEENSSFCLSPLIKHSSMASTQSDSLSFIE